MNLYIVKAYEDERKLNIYSDVFGYYTSKTALIRNDDFRTLNTVAETGTVEITETNT